MLRLRLLLLGVLLGAAFLSPRAHADPDETFVSREGRFAAVFPEVPQEERSGRDTWAGWMEEGSYEVEGPGLRLRVEFHDVPRLATLALPSATILDLARQGVLDDRHASNVSSEKLTLRGHPGLALRYELGGKPGATEEAHLFLVGARLFVTFARIDAPGAPSMAATRFLASFDAWEPGDAVASVERRSGIGM